MLRAIMLLFGCLFIITICPSAFAQSAKEVPDFAPSLPGMDLSQPDWSGFLPQSKAPSSGSKLSFFDRCIATPDPVLEGHRQVEMCACMAANQEAVKGDHKDQYWMNAYKARTVSPYETFVTRIFAPCMYLEAQTLALSDCYRETHYTVMFDTQRGFDNYCRCYADQAEKYMHDYAAPIIAARMARNAGSQIDQPIDPVQTVLDEPDYGIFMEKRRHECIAEYGVQTSH